MKGLTSLTTLGLRGCPSLQNVDGLENLTALTKRNLSFCRRLQNVDALKNVPALTTLYLYECPALSEQAVTDLQRALPNTRIYTDY